MKLIIDIPKKEYELRKMWANSRSNLCTYDTYIIANGIPFTGGTWNVGGEGTTHYYTCSVCGSSGNIWDHFCRNCGSDMRGLAE